jgi:hypothetical protein
MSKLRFDPAAHEYWLGKKRLPTVTQVINFGLHGDEVANRWGTEFHRSRGSAVHMAMSLILKDDLDESTVDPRIEKFLSSFKNFVADSGFKPRIGLCEKPMHHEALGYAGTPDIVGMMGKRPAVVECKTTVLGYAAIQSAAYERMIRQHMRSTKGITRFGLLLREDGYSLNEYKDPGDWPTFMQMLKLWKEAHQ